MREGEIERPRRRRSKSGTAQPVDVTAVLTRIAQPLANALGSETEVIVHDLRHPEHSVVAVGGNVTGRNLGAPLTDLLLRTLQSGACQDLTNYRTRTSDGRPLRSSTIFIKDGDTPVACLCINTDISAWHMVHEIAGGQIDPDADEGHSLRNLGAAEKFPLSVPELVSVILERAVDRVGVPPHLMRRTHRRAVVQALDEAGVFLINDAVDYVASALNVSRYTIYSYLRETANQTVRPQRSPRRATTKRLHASKRGSSSETSTDPISLKAAGDLSDGDDAPAAARSAVGRRSKRAGADPPFELLGTRGSEEAEMTNRRTSR